MAKTFTLKSFIIATLRRASYRWIPRNQALVAARVSRNQYKCNLCGGLFGRKEVKVDHINPVVPITGWDNYEHFIERLFCNKEGFQILCDKDHKEKTQQENILRKKYKILDKKCHKS